MAVEWSLDWLDGCGISVSPLMLSVACRPPDRLDAATSLRRDLGFWPGVAANLIGLAHIAAAEKRDAVARAHLEEAAALAVRHAPGLVPDIADAQAAIGPTG